MLQRYLMGPQRPITNLGDAIASAQLPEGPIAVISAGWQEAEDDLDEIQELVQGPLVDLRLYHRAEEVFSGDDTLRSAYRERQDRLQEQQRLYRLRLRQLMIAARQMKRASAAPDLLVAEQRHAYSQLRALDRHQLHRIDSLYGQYEDRIAPHNSVLLAEHMAAIEQAVEDCSAVIITGGNVVVLLNRLQLFDMKSTLANRHLIAWSAGAMVLSDTIVLYHDKTPLGRRDPEVLGAGMGILPGYVFLPNASKRLRENDPVRMGLFNGRFSPASCVTLDSGSLVHFDGDRVRAADGAGHLTSSGSIGKLRTV